MEGILDVQTFRETAQAAGREPASAIADGWVLAGEPVRRQENGMAKIELPLAANVLFTDPAGKLHAAIAFQQGELSARSGIFCSKNNIGVSSRTKSLFMKNGKAIFE